VVDEGVAGAAVNLSAIQSVSELQCLHGWNQDISGSWKTILRLAGISI
jgi:hypothetical protein